MRLAAALLTVSVVTAAGIQAADAAPISVLNRNGASVAVEAYGPNAVHVTIAVDRKEIDKGPGYGILARNADNKAFAHTADAAGTRFRRPR